MSNDYHGLTDKAVTFEIPMWVYEKLLERSAKLNAIEMLVKSGEKNETTDAMEMLLGVEEAHHDCD